MVDKPRNVPDTAKRPSLESSDIVDGDFDMAERACDGYVHRSFTRQQLLCYDEERKTEGCSHIRFPAAEIGVRLYRSRQFWRKLA